jgi:hypothetical protein
VEAPLPIAPLPSAKLNRDLLEETNGLPRAPGIPGAVGGMAGDDGQAGCLLLRLRLRGLCFRLAFLRFQALGVRLATQVCLAGGVEFFLLEALIE